MRKLLWGAILWLSASAANAAGPAPVAAGNLPSSVPSVSGANTWTGQQTFTSVLGTVVTEPSTARVLTSGDCGKEINFTASTAVTVTVPSTLGAGCNVALRQGGAGKVSVAAGSGTTVNNPHSFAGTYAQFSILGVSIVSNSSGLNAVADLSGDGA